MNVQCEFAVPSQTVIMFSVTCYTVTTAITNLFPCKRQNNTKVASRVLTKTDAMGE